MLYSLAMKLRKMSQTLIDRWTPILLAFSALLLYVTFRSISLDDFDSYSFALALDHFSLELQQPQPPGFPIYIFLGRALYRVTGDPTSALTLLSAVSGAGVTVLVYALGRLMDRDTTLTGVLAALLLGLIPMGWLTAEKALSDTLGLLATLVAMWLLWKAASEDVENLHQLTLAALVTGLSLGVRPQNALPLALFGGFAVVRALVQARTARPLIVAGGFSLIGVTLWLIPTALAVGGLSAYVSQIQSHATHVGRADSLLGMGLPLTTAVRARALAFGDTFLTSTIGVGTFAAWGVRQMATAALIAAFVAVGLVRADWRRREAWWLGLWAVVVTAQVFLFENLDRPRLMLPILPPLALLVAHGWSRVRRPRWLTPIVMIAIAVALLVQGVPLAAQLATIPAPPAQATAYVAAHFPPEETLIATAGSFRAVQVELPAYRQAYLYRFDVEAVQRALAEGMRYVVIVDRDQFPADALATLSADGRYVPLEERTFVRDRRVHTQHDQVRVQVLTPAELVPFEALSLPPGGCIDVGSESDGRYLAQGWFRPEDIGGAQGRWAGETLTSTVRVTLASGLAHRLRFRAMAYPAGQTVTVSVWNREVASLALVQGWSEYEVLLPADVAQPDEITTLALVHTAARAPFDATGGSSSDTRALTAAYDWLCFEKVP